MSIINSQPLIGASGSSGYQISRSVRLRSSASAYFSRTPASAATDGKKWTYSAWVKRGTLGVFGSLLAADNGSGTSTAVYFETDNTLKYVSGATTHKTSAMVFRDISAFYHIVVAIDTTQATGANRAVLYVNGVQQTWTSGTDPTLNSISRIGQQSILQGIGFSVGSVASTYFDGYITEVNFIDGQALTPSSFGETNQYTGVWQPKKYNGTYGTNGFYLNFSDNSGVTATTIGKDYSGNGNNWTPNNISVTAGATYDSMLDVPTNWADGGNGRGNYAVVSILDVDRANITTSNGNLTNVKATFSDSPRVVASIGAKSGKWYAEITWSSITNSAPNANYLLTGVTTKEQWSSTSNGFNVVGYFAANAPGAAIAGYKQITTAGSSVNSAYGSNYFTNGSVIGIALDLDAGTVTFYTNGVSQGAITLPTTSEEWFIFCTSDGTSNGYTNHFNFGQRPFTYTLPTGFKALNTQNLPDPTIKKGNQYFDVLTWTGDNSSSRDITGLNFQPDLAWVKNRGNAANHRLSDSVRGAGKTLYSDLTNAEASADVNGDINGFLSNGITLRRGSTNANGVNDSPYGYVGWQWKEGATQGFDIVTYTAPASGSFSVNHSLGVAPAMVICKTRGSTGNWGVWHKSLASTTDSYLNLNTTQAVQTQAGIWGSGNTSTTTGGLVGWSDAANTTAVRYLFAEVPGFSKFGSYTGNGSANGPFVFLGFRPRFVMIKETTAASTSDWVMHDTSRATYNADDYRLLANSSGAELNTGFPIDELSNGFKVRNAGNGANRSAGTYIYAAFAEVPYKFALAR